MANKNTLLNEFNVKKKEKVVNDVRDFEVFPDKEKLDLPSMIISLEEFYDRILNSDFNKFSEITGDVIYELQGNQLCMLFIDDIDSLCEYFDYDVVEMNDEGQYTRPIIKKRPNNIH